MYPRGHKEKEKRVRGLAWLTWLLPTFTSATIRRTLGTPVSPSWSEAGSLARYLTPPGCTNREKQAERNPPPGNERTNETLGVVTSNEFDGKLVRYAILAKDVAGMHHVLGRQDTTAMHTCFVHWEVSRRPQRCSRIAPSYSPQIVILEYPL